MKPLLFMLSCCTLLSSCQSTQPAQEENASHQAESTADQEDDYIVAAYVWPAYHHEPRMKEFYRGDDGEWERIWNAEIKAEGMDQPRQPLWGYVHEDDPQVMEMKIDAAANHGVDVFIYDWYWYENQPYLEEALNEGFLKAKNRDRMKFYLMWANHDATTLWDIERSADQVVVWPGYADRPTFDSVVQRVIQKYFMEPTYFKIDGKPVFSIYHLENLVKGLGGLEQTKEAIQSFREEVKKAGFPGLHLQITSRGRYLKNDFSFQEGSNISFNSLTDAISPQSMTTYNWVHHSGASGDYVQWGMKSWDAMEKLDSSFSFPYWVHVSVGWDNNPRFVELKGFVYNAHPASFKAFLHKAKAYVDSRPEAPPVIVINSWSEWVEGSSLEPDMRWGYRYLEAIEDVFGEE
jgi:hypothetical protein